MLTPEQVLGITTKAYYISLGTSFLAGVCLGIIATLTAKIKVVRTDNE